MAQVTKAPTIMWLDVTEVTKSDSISISVTIVEERSHGQDPHVTKGTLFGSHVRSPSVSGRLNDVQSKRFHFELRFSKNDKVTKYRLQI